MQQENASKPRQLTVAVIGNPNTGKSTLFTALTGVHSRIGNYPGVTVEKKLGRLEFSGWSIQLVDLPGTYSLSPRSLDELVSVDVLLGRQPDVGKIDVVVCIADASNLERNLYLFSQILDLGLPTVLVLNMWDVAVVRGTKIDIEELRRRLGQPVIVCEAHRRRNIEEIKQAIVSVVEKPVSPSPRIFPENFYDEGRQLQKTLFEWSGSEVPFYVAERLLLDVDGQIEQSFRAKFSDRFQKVLATARERLAAAGIKIPAAEAKMRYAWSRQILKDVVIRPTSNRETASDKLDHWLTHRVWGVLVFLLVMFLVFQSISTFAEPLMNGMEEGQKFVAGRIAGWLPAGPFRSLLIDGVIAGVGGILVFLPQICFLFLFIALLEDCGYMARAAFL
ncbi:MAG: ferrous iron transporter B, partial [Planctomycetes bacterium]|nr:ferrous iron transporter B [Planctomycetota bacterium]